MSREAHVRFWEGVGVQLLCATQLASGCRGRNRLRGRTKRVRDISLLAIRGDHDLSRHDSHWNGRYDVVGRGVCHGNRVGLAIHGVESAAIRRVGADSFRSRTLPNTDRVCTVLVAVSMTDTEFDPTFVI